MGCFIFTPVSNRKHKSDGNRPG